MRLYKSIEELKDHRFKVYYRGEPYGYLYVCELGDYTKIGITKDVITRLMTHSANARIYGNKLIGRICVSASFSFYKELESYFHNMFYAYKKDKEIFDIPFDRVVDAMRETMNEPFFKYIYAL